MAKIEKSKYRQILGAWGESRAADFLQQQGLTLLGKNFRTAAGEIDLIAQDGDELVFVEVKTRSSADFGYPEEAVTETKIEHLLEVSESYLLEHLEVQSWRLDVVAIQGKPGEDAPEIEWFKDVR